MITIGRDRKNDIVLTDASVAAHHAHIESIDGNRLVISDQGTQSGTFLLRDGQWIQVIRVCLGPLDTIRFGNCEMTWKELSGSSAGFGIRAAPGKTPAGLVVPGKPSNKPVFEHPKRNPLTGAVEERDPDS